MQTTYPPTQLATVLVVVSCTIVALSAKAATEGASLGVNMLFTTLAGASMAIVILATIRGHGRSGVRARVMGIGLVVAVIGAIQLVQLWNDGLGMPAWGTATALVALTLLGLAGVVLGRRLRADEADEVLRPAPLQRP